MQLSTDLEFVLALLKVVVLRVVALKLI